MNETDAVVEARREVYRTASLVMLIIILLVLAVVGLGLPLLYTSKRDAFYRSTSMSLPPIIRQGIITYCTPTILLLGTGLLGMVLVVKEILAAPKVRYWANVVMLVLLLIWGICCVYVTWQPALWVLMYMR